MQPPLYQPPPQNPYAFGPPPVPPKKGMSGWAIAGIILGGGCLLLVVGGSILAAILFPVFAQAREKARRSACLSNLSRIGLASLMYAQDYDDKLPPSTQWMDRLKRYTRTENLYHCPSVAPGGDRSDPSRPYGYAMDSRVSGKSTMKMKTPANVVLVYDSTNTARNATDAGASRAARHVGGASVGYVDGHVKYVKTGANP